MKNASRPSRAARLVALGGLATGLGLAGGTALAASSPGPSPSGAATAPAQPPDHPGGPGGPGGGPGGPGGPGGGPRRGPGMMGGGGTITAISDSTLTLRTEAGTLTVTTDSSTTFHHEHDTIALSDLKVGDVVHLQPVKPAEGAAKPDKPDKPGTGTIAAADVRVVEDTLGGRVTEISGDTITVVGREGRIYTVTTSSSTEYYKGKDEGAAADVTVDSRIMAEGSQDSTTHITADEVIVLPNPPVR